jgi:hypothetical protein
MWMTLAGDLKSRIFITVGHRPAEQGLTESIADFRKGCILFSERVHPISEKGASYFFVCGILIILLQLQFSI